MKPPGSRTSAPPRPLSLGLELLLLAAGLGLPVLLPAHLLPEAGSVVDARLDLVARVTVPFLSALTVRRLLQPPSELLVQLGVNRRGALLRQLPLALLAAALLSAVVAAVVLAEARGGLDPLLRPDLYATVPAVGLGALATTTFYLGASRLFRRRGLGLTLALELLLGGLDTSAGLLVPSGLLRRLLALGPPEGMTGQELSLGLLAFGLSGLLLSLVTTKS